MSLKIAPYHRFNVFDLRPMAVNLEEDYNLSSVMAGEYAKKHEIGRAAGQTISEVLALLGGFDLESYRKATGDDFEFSEYDDVVPTLSRIFSKFETKTPGPGMYQAYGFAPMPNAFDGNGKPMFASQVPGQNWFVFNILINERKLPRSSLNKPIAERVAEFTRKEQREPSRKEFAVMRDAIEAKMLANAPVVPKIVPVMIMDARCFIFTSSPTQAQLVCNLLRTVIGTWPVAPAFEDESTLSNVMDNVVRAHRRYDALDKDAEGCAEFDEDFFPGHAATFADPDGSKITIKNELISDREGWGASDAIARNYSTTELEMHCVGTGKQLTLDQNFNPVYVDRMQIKLSNNGVVKKFALPDLDAPRLHNMVDTMPNLEHSEHEMAHMALLYLVGSSIEDLIAMFKRNDMLRETLDVDQILDGDTVDRGLIGLRNEEADQEVLDELQEVDAELGGSPIKLSGKGWAATVGPSMTGPVDGIWEVFNQFLEPVGATKFKNIAKHWLQELTKDPNYDPDLDDFTPVGIAEGQLQGDDDDI